MKSKILSLFLTGLAFLSVGLLTQTASVKSVKTVPLPTLTPKKEVLSSKQASLEENQFLIIKVLDGDTILSSTGDKIRYIGINAPEKGQPFSNESTKLNEALVLNKTVNLKYDVQTKDRYGRILAYVFINGVLVNGEIVKKGLAVSETIQPNVSYQKEFLDGQKYARENCFGMWGNLCGKNSVKNCIGISSIYANAYGDDNKNKNGEWIEIKNNCPTDTVMKGWLIKDNSASNGYTFKDFLLGKGKKVQLFSGCGVDSQDKLYWKCPEQKYSVWNNTSDHAYLYNEKGELVSDYQY